MAKPATARRSVNSTMAAIAQPLTCAIADDLGRRKLR
jgi:hypothetical protein